MSANFSDFDMFWAAYPYKVDKDAARRAMAKALKRVSIHAVMAGLEAQTRAGVFEAMIADARRRGLSNPKQLIKYPATWLNAGSWENELPEAPCRPAFRNGALELLARDAETGVTIDATADRTMLEGPERG
jgi:hypothetical protein